MSAPRQRGRSAIRRQGLFCAGALVGLGLLAGCDQLPWSPKAAQPATGRDATTASTSPAASRLFVAPDDVVVAVNGVPISKADVEIRVEELKGMVAASGQTWTPLPVQAPEGELSLTAVLEGLVNNELLSQEAFARGLDRETQTQRRWEYLRRGFFAQEWLRWHQQRQDVTADEVTAYYEQYKAGFRKPERLRVRQLTVGLEDQAKHALVQLHEGGNFETLAQELSTSPTSKAGGLLTGWVMRSDDKANFAADDPDVIALDPVLESAVFAIDAPNRISNYVKGPDGQFHIFQLVERKADEQRALAEVWDDIKTFLAVQKLSELIEQLQAKAKIERHLERLEGLTQ